MFLSWKVSPRGSGPDPSTGRGWIPWLAVMPLLAGTASSAQQPAPLPQPKPIVVAPLPKPGQVTPRSKPAAGPAETGSAEPARKDPTPAPRTVKPTTPKAAEVSYGTTPVPWPKGSSNPAHFPKEIPRFPSARQASFSMSIQVASAFFLCDEPPEAIAKFYGDFIAREKWNPIPIPGPPLQGDRIVIAEKGDWTLRVDAVRNPLDGATEVFVNVALKPLPPPPKPAEKQEGKRP
jgi:hypothetical protein